MDEKHKKDYQAVVLGALLHDIGKFYQRATRNVRERHTKLGEAVFQNYFREALSKFFSPDELNTIEGGIGNHHDYAEYITPADWLSAGMDRIPLEDEEKGDPSKARLLSVFDNISLGNHISGNKYSYDLKVLSLNKNEIFPQQFQSDIDLSKQYSYLWDNFIKELKCFNVTNLKAYIRSLYYLLLKHTWCIPSAAYKSEPDISLFEHVKSTAAIAGCLYHHKKADEGNDKEFMLVGGDISGIQNFIYRITKSQGIKGISKMLRGRSFYLFLLQEVITKYIIEQTSLLITNILFCGGGRFELLLPNTNEVKNVVKEFRNDINKWLFELYDGELGIVIEKMEADKDELSDYGNLLQKLDKKLTMAKKKKYLSFIKEPSFCVEGINKKDIVKICRVCNISKTTSDEPCKICNLHKGIGKRLPRTSYLIYTKESANIEGYPIPFGKFGNVYFLDKDYQLKDIWFESDTILDIQKINDLDNIKAGFCFIGNTAPIAKEGFSVGSDQEDEDKSVKAGDVLSFEMIADASIGDKRMGVLKMDVDHLGLIFAIGLEEEQNPTRKSISRIYTMSRSVDMFFGGYINKICDDIYREWMKESNWKHRNKVEHIFYIVYSGGDDLLIIGSWSEIPKLAKKIRDEFKEYTCNNLDINISAGIFFCKPKYPISRAANIASEQLETSKDNKRNRITLFSDTVEWSGKDKLCIDELLDYGEYLYRLINSGKLPRGFVHGLLRKHKQYNKGQDPNFIPAIIYQLTRNVKDNELRNELKAKLITDMRSFFKHIKIPASYALLKSRKE